MRNDNLVFVRLTLDGQDSRMLSQNFYWRADSDADYRMSTSLHLLRLLSPLILIVEPIEVP